MDASNIYVSSSSLAWPSCTTNTIPSNDNTQSSTRKERNSPQAMVLNGLSLPLVQIAQQEGQQTPFQLVSDGTSFAIENANLSVIFTPQPQTVLQKTSQTLTLNIVNPLPILSPTSPAGFMGANSGKSKSVGKHICGHCGRDCLKPSVLEKHIRSHTGERPFPCNICGVSFKTQSNLYKHRRTQTHVNNAKQSCDSDCGSCHEDKIYEQVGHNTSFDISSGMRDVCIDNNPVQESDTVPGNKEDVSILSSLRIHDKTHGDSDYSTQTIFSPGMPNLQTAVIDPKSTSSSRHGQLQRQYEASVDKQWDGTLSERKLKKCESTDSGYLSHSDSADLQMFAGSPLHSLSECSMESENMLGIGSGESEDKSSSSYKKNLEEHISMLISHNKVVVDNTHLDNVRPRKTALSKQGSIDLPMPYTFKDSFHFDIKSLDASRKKVTLCSTKSTFTPSEKNKPLFFHSVPTQISTTIENIILSRSNSLPFVESGKLKDKLTIHNIKSHGSGKQHLNASYGNLLLSNTATACTVDFSCSHPRGLVRQAAVDEMHIGIGSDTTISGDIKEKKKVAVDQLSSKLNTASKKGGQKKSNMFSHEKWQMYGDESFKKFYQKMKKNDQVKKTKQESPESTGLINNKVCLKSACELEKSSENLSSMSVVSSPTSNLQLTSAMTIAGIGMNIPVSTGNPPVTLNDESGGQGNQPETKLQSNLNISKDDINSLQNVLVNVPGSSTGVTDNSGTVVTENQPKVLSISSIHDFLDINYTDNYQSNEISPSDRKKPKVAQLKGEILYSVSLDIEEDSIEHQNKSVDDITDSGNITRMLGGEGSNKVVSCQLLSTIISHAEDSKQISAQSNKSRLFSPTIQPPLALKETLFSPRYLIKFRFTGASLNESVLQSNQPAVSGSISKDTDLFNLHHPTSLENQPHKIQKHDSVISPFGKKGLNEECLSICCASKISQHLVQNKSLDTQKVRLNGTYPERRHTFQNHTVVTEGQRVEKALISKQINLKSTMVLSNSSTTSANEVTKLSQDQFLLDIIQSGQTCCKPLNATELLNLKNSLFSTTCTHSPSGICSVKVTQVSFSTMNTEPKSTWCWLDRCLPFPAEQKEKSYSVYASLSSNTFKERRSEPNRRIENNMNHRTTFDDQSMISSLLMSVKEKDDVDKETDNGNYYPLVKKSIKMGTVMKSKHVKRSKDGTRGRSHCKMLQHRSSRILVQDQQHKKNIGPASLESGEVLLVSTNLELSDKEGSRTSIHHQPFQGNLGQGSEAKALLDSQMNEATISTAPAASEQMVTAEDNLSLSMEKMAHPEPPQSPSLLWQKSCSSVLQKGSQVQHKHLTGFPRQKHVKKILHRSKTIGHSLGDNPVGSTSNCTSSDSQPKLPVEAKDGTRRSSLQNMHSTDFYLAPKTSNSGSNPRSGTLSFSQTLQSENYGAPSGLQLHGFKTQKKINLEVIRKQTHVEYSDSDDEDRLYIEIE